MIWYDVMWYDIRENWERDDKKRQDRTVQEKTSRVRSKMKRNLKKSSYILMYTRIAKWWPIVIIREMKTRKQNRMRGTKL